MAPARRAARLHHRPAVALHDAVRALHAEHHERAGAGRRARPRQAHPRLRQRVAHEPAEPPRHAREDRPRPAPHGDPPDREPPHRARRGVHERAGDALDQLHGRRRLREQDRPGDLRPGHRLRPHALHADRALRPGVVDRQLDAGPRRGPGAARRVPARGADLLRQPRRVVRLRPPRRRPQVRRVVPVRPRGRRRRVRRDVADPPRAVEQVL